jgi:hypothetical protein
MACPVGAAVLTAISVIGAAQEAALEDLEAALAAVRRLAAFVEARRQRPVCEMQAAVGAKPPRPVITVFHAALELSPRPLRAAFGIAAELRAQLEERLSTPAAAHVAAVWRRRAVAAFDTVLQGFAGAGIAPLLAAACLEAVLAHLAGEPRAALEAARGVRALATAAAARKEAAAELSAFLRVAAFGDAVLDKALG